MKRTIWVLGCFLLCGVLVADGKPTDGQELEPRKARQPWEWTDEERLAERFDPIKIRERAEDAQRREQALAQDLPDLNQDLSLVRIYGERNPELFLAIEVFRSFLRDAVFSQDPEIRETFRRSMKERHPDLPLDDEFWRRLEEIGTPLLTHIREEAAIFRAANEEGAPKKAHADLEAYLKARDDQAICLLRAQALEKARATFGRVLFDRILYETKAPSMAVVHRQSMGPEQLLFLARGCPE
jgi:hypothetical protein